MTHMAPELLMMGHVSKASDVYAYGILLWEICTQSQLTHVNRRDIR